MDAKEPEKNRPLIVYAEDNHQLYETVKLFFGLEGYDVQNVVDGEKVVNLTRAEESRAEKSRLALILMDLKMPKKSGLEATRDIRKFSNVPIILVTAYGSEETKQACLKLGCNDYFKKPFEGGKLLLAVQNHARKFKREGWVESR